MSSLNSAQLKQYEEEGYVAPIDVLSKEEAKEVREEIELIEKKWPNELEGLGRNYIHLISPVFDKVCNNTKILDAVEMLNSKNTSRSLSFNSAGRCLIYGDNERVIEVAEALSEYLGVSALLTKNISIIPPTNTDFNLLMGKVKSLKGYFGNFEVKIDNFAEALPQSKDEIIFGDVSQDVSSECDIFIDLSGSDPLISSHEKRDGYYKVNPEDKTALQKLILDAQTKIGEFEMPI